jgi:hypothetical protein
MKRKLWIAAAVIALVLGAAGYTIAQSTGTTTQGGPGWIMGSGMMGTMGPGAGMMGMMSMMSGQPLTPEQLEQFAKQHGITVEQAKQMTDACTQIMARTNTPETPKQ